MVWNVSLIYILHKKIHCKFITELAESSLETKQEHSLHVLNNIKDFLFFK